MTTDSKRWFRLVSIAALSMTMSSRAMTTEPSTWLAALAQVESGDNPRAVGAAGERSRWQITEAAWVDHCHCSFTHAKDDELARIIALKIRHSNQARFKNRTDRMPTPRDEYAMWNLGLEGYVRFGIRFSRLPKTYRDRAQRFENLYREFSSAPKRVVGLTVPATANPSFTGNAVGARPGAGDR